MASAQPGFGPFAERMRAENLPEIAIRTFEHYYNLLASGETGLLPERSLRPIGEIDDVQSLADSLSEAGATVLPQTVLLKLNGGLGTSMGLDRAKSLLVVKNGLTFLDIIARQALQARVRLLLMNSFSTREDSLALLRLYPELWGDIPLDFLQHKVPKVAVDGLRPAVWPQDPSLEWAPPGHGDLYTALVTSGMLDTLLRAGYHYAFVSNADNLGATMDTKILGYFAEKQMPFLMEVAERTPMDTKGGHVAQLPDGRLILRESAQCPPEDLDAFQDITRHRYFNTNSLWLNLDALKSVMTAKDGILGLPLIRNRKTVDPRDPDSTPVYQLETAMGAAISLFPDAVALRVPRTRFVPVKTTNELLAVRSDAYVLTDDFRVVTNPDRSLGPLVVELDSRHYRLIDELDNRFPHGAPSLVKCESLSIKGDFRFGRDVKLRGRVRLVNDAEAQVVVDDGEVIEM